MKLLTDFQWNVDFTKTPTEINNTHLIFYLSFWKKGSRIHHGSVDNHTNRTNPTWGTVQNPRAQPHGYGVRCPSPQFYATVRATAHGSCPSLVSLSAKIFNLRHLSFHLFFAGDWRISMVMGKWMSMSFLWLASWLPVNWRVLSCLKLCPLKWCPRCRVWCPEWCNSQWSGWTQRVSLVYSLNFSSLFLSSSFWTWKAFGSDLFGVSMPGDAMGGEYDSLGPKN